MQNEIFQRGMRAQLAEWQRRLDAGEQRIGNDQYLDKNYGGILILWDRLFGTFEPEVRRVKYGLTKNIHTYNPLRIAYHETADIARDVRAATGLRRKLGHIFGRPGWTPASSR